MLALCEIRSGEAAAKQSGLGSRVSMGPRDKPEDDTFGSVVATKVIPGLVPGSSHRQTPNHGRTLDPGNGCRDDSWGATRSACDLGEVGDVEGGGADLR